MKFDIMSYLENYKTLEFITGSQIGALWLCVLIGVVVWVISYSMVGFIFEHIGFSGNGKLMSKSRMLISTIITSVFYGFLDIFKQPIAWAIKNWAISCIVVLGLFFLPSIYGFVEDLYYRHCENNK